MFIRNQKDDGMFIGGKSVGQLLSKPNTYPAAFPFDRCAYGAPGPVAFVALHGQASGVTTETDLWGQAIIRTLPTDGFTFGVSSSSANDVATTGTGARTVEIDVLDTDYKPYTYTVSLNGQTKVTDTNLVGTCLRINDIRVVSSGSGKTNAGDIYVYDSSDTVTAGVPQTSTKIFHKIMAGDTVARGAFYCVPAGCKLQTQQFRGGFNDLVNTSRVGIFSVAYSNSSLAAKFPISAQLAVYSGMATVSPDFPLVFNEKTDVFIKCAASASAVMTAYLDSILFYA